MEDENYWTAWRTAALSRRRLLASAGAGAAGLTAVGLAACGSKPNSALPAGSSSPTGNQAQSGSPKAGGNFSSFLNFNPTLDPQRNSALGQQSISGVMSRVFRFKTGADPNVSANHEIENDLGISAESPDAITWTIKLRTGATFSNIAPVNGHAVEAEDVKATFARALDPANNDPNRGALNMIDPAQIQTPDKQTVVFRLAFPYSPFRSILASANYSWVFPREVLGGGYDPSKIAIGSGPFLLDAATPDVAYTYKKRADWFEQGRPYVDSWRYAIIPDASQQLAQFTAGNLDEFVFRDPYQVNAVQQQNPKATILKADNGVPLPLYFQMGDPTSVFQDIRVRRAVSMALDRDAISKAVYNGETEQVVYVPAYMGKWSLKVSELPADIQQYYKANPAEAKKLLDAAGATNLQLKIAYPQTFGTPPFAKQVETIANMLGAIGMKVTIVTQDYNRDFVDAGKGSRQGYFDKDTMMFASTSPYTDADEWLFSYFHSKSTSNQEHLSDPKYDAMVDKERTLVNEDDRLKAVKEIQQYLAQQMYAPSTVGTFEWTALQPRVQGYQYTSNSTSRGTETYSKLWIG